MVHKCIFSIVFLQKDRYIFPMVFWLATIFISLFIVLAMCYTVQLGCSSSTSTSQARPSFVVLASAMLGFIFLNFALYALYGSADLFNTPFARLAPSQFASQNYARATYSYEQAMKHTPATAPLLVGYVLSQAAMTVGFLINDNNLLLLKQAEQLAPNDIYPPMLIALALRQKKHYKEASEHLKSFLQTAHLSLAETIKIQALLVQYKIK